MNYVRANASSRVGLTTIVYKGETGDRLSNSRSDQLESYKQGETDTYEAGTKVQIDVDLRDKFGNVATIDTAHRELLVKFQDKNGNGGGGDFIIAQVSRNFEGMAAGFGYKANATLTRAAEYAVTAQIGGAQLCVSNNTCNAMTCGDDPINFTAIDVCIHDANVTVAKASAEKSLLLGSGAVKDGRIVAGTEVSLAVVPLDAYGNVITKDSSAYEFNVTRDSDKHAEESKKPMTYDADDGTHTGTYKLTKSGVYTVGVTQTAPDGDMFHTVGGADGEFNVTIVAGDPKLDNTQVAVAASSFAAGEDGSVDITLRDANDNDVEEDRTHDLVVKMIPSSTSSTSRTFASTDDSSAPGTGGRGFDRVEPHAAQARRQLQHPRRGDVRRRRVPRRRTRRRNERLERAVHRHRRSSGRERHERRRRRVADGDGGNAGFVSRRRRRSIRQQTNVSARDDHPRRARVGDGTAEYARGVRRRGRRPVADGGLELGANAVRPCRTRRRFPNVLRSRDDGRDGRDRLAVRGRGVAGGGGRGEEPRVRRRGARRRRERRRSGHRSRGGFKRKLRRERR